MVLSLLLADNFLNYCAKKKLLKLEKKCLEIGCDFYELNDEKKVFRFRTIRRGKWFNIDKRHFEAFMKEYNNA